jgi:hypothetical protein
MFGRWQKYVGMYPDFIRDVIGVGRAVQFRSGDDVGLLIYLLWSVVYN